MTRFVFRLESVRRWYETQRDEQRARLAEAMQAEEIVKSRRAALYQELKQLDQNTRDRNASGPLDIDRLLNTKRYQQSLQIELRNLTDQHATIADEVEKRRQELVTADRQLRLLEKLKERKSQQHQIEADRAEVRLLDEAASILHHRSATETRSNR